MANNQLSGSIPDTLGNLTRLDYLELENNQLSGLIPGTLVNLARASLRTLQLASNQLQGSFPLTVSSISSLESISLEWNSLYTSDINLDVVLDFQSGSDWSSTQTIAPSNVMVADVGANTVGLSWDAIEYTDVSGRYVVSHSTSPGGPYIDGGSTINKNVTSLTVNGLASGTAYYFVVTSETDNHDSNQSKLISESSDEVFAKTLGGDAVFSDGFETPAE